MSHRGQWIDCVANELGIENLHPDLVQELENYVKNEIQQIIQESIKFARHSYRKRLLPSDIHCTLNMRNSPPIIGCNAPSTFFDPNKPSSQQKNDNNNNNNSEKLTIPKSGNNIMIKDDPLRTLEEIKNELITKPAPISVIVSWLAINGQVIGSQTQQINKHNNESLRIPKKGGSSLLKNKIEIKPIECHDISKEQQLFFEVLRNTVVKGNINTLNTFIDILQNSDAGLARLVPRIVSFIAKSVKDNVNNLQLIDCNFLYCLMRIAESLILSRYLSNYLENYLQQFMPPILTCCMKENLSLSPSENHWDLRNKSARIVNLVLHKFGTKFPSVRAKVIKTITKYFNDFTKTFKTHYGAIVCMKELGIDALQTGLLPNIKIYINIKLKPVINGGIIDNNNKNKKMDTNSINNIKQNIIKQNVIKQYEAKMVLSVILECLYICNQHQINDINGDNEFNSDKNKKMLSLYKELEEMFGEALIPFNSMPPDCQNYFI